MKFSLPIIFFINHTFGVTSKKSLQYPRLSRFFPVLSSKSLIVLHFTYKSMIHFEQIFVKSAKSVSEFILLCEDDGSLFQYHLLRTLSLLHCIVLCQRWIDYIYNGLFLSSLFCSTDLFFCHYHAFLITITLP